MATHFSASAKIQARNKFGLVRFFEKNALASNIVFPRFRVT